MPSLDKILDIIPIALIGVGGLIGLSAIGGVKGLKDLFGGLSGGLAAAPEAAAQASTDVLGGLASIFGFGQTQGLTAAEQASLATQQNLLFLQGMAQLQPGQDPFTETAAQLSGRTQFIEAKLDQLQGDLDSGLINQQQFDLLQENFMARTGAPGTEDPPPITGGGGSTSPALTPSEQFFAGDISIGNLAQTLQRQADADREAEAQRQREIPEQQVAGATTTVLRNLGSFEANVAQVQQIRETQGDDAADRAASMLRL